jgi:hypothetical protein
VCVDFPQANVDSHSSTTTMPLSVRSVQHHASAKTLTANVMPVHCVAGRWKKCLPKVLRPPRDPGSGKTPSIGLTDAYASSFHPGSFSPTDAPVVGPRIKRQLRKGSSCTLGNGGTKDTIVRIAKGIGTSPERVVYSIGCGHNIVTGELRVVLSGIVQSAGSQTVTTMCTRPTISLMIRAKAGESVAIATRSKQNARKRKLHRDAESRVYLPPLFETNRPTRIPSQ